MRVKWFQFVLLKSFPFFKLFVRFTLLKQSAFPIINTFVAVLYIVWVKTLLWYILFSFSKRSVFTFVIIKPKTELCFRLYNIGSIITNFASQKVNNFFWVTVKGSILNFKYFPTCCCCKNSVVIIRSHTWQVPSPHRSEPPALSIFGSLSVFYT